MFGFSGKITPRAMTIALGMADDYIRSHEREIPARVIVAWSEFRQSLVDWQTELEKREQSKHG